MTYTSALKAISVAVAATRETGVIHLAQKVADRAYIVRDTGQAA